MTCTNCSGLLQLAERTWRCAWCDARGTYAQGPLLRNGKRWRVRVVEHAGRVEHCRGWMPAGSMTHAERVAEQKGTI